MKHRFLHFFVAMCGLFLTSTLMAQSPTYHQGWMALEESTSFIDVSYAVVQCDSSSGDEILLHVFNENASTQSVSFTIDIEDPSSTSTSSFTVSNLSLTAGEMVQAECGSTANASLRTPVPAGFDPSALTIDITYN